MNLWGFTPSILTELKKRFPKFLDKVISENLMKEEFFLPTVVDELLKENRATVRILCSQDQWYGVTYRPDHAVVVAAMQRFKERGLYPDKLWGNEK